MRKMNSFVINSLCHLMCKSFPHQKLSKLLSQICILNVSYPRLFNPVNTSQTFSHIANFRSVFCRLVKQKILDESAF